MTFGTEYAAYDHRHSEMQRTRTMKVGYSLLLGE